MTPLRGNSPSRTPPHGNPPDAVAPHNNSPHTSPPRTPLPRSLSPLDLDCSIDSEDEEPDDSQAGHGISSGNPGLLDTQVITVHLEDLKNTIAAIKEIQNTSSST